MFIRFLIAFLILTGSSSGVSASHCRDIFLKPIPAAMPSPYRSLPKLPVGMNLEDFPENTVARVYVEFAVRNMLMNQQAKTLEQRGLLLPNGGLCGFSCISNITGAIAAQEGNFLSFPQRAPQVTEDLVVNYSADTGEDGRLGAHINILTVATMGPRFPEILQAFGYHSLFDNIHLHSALMDSDFTPELIANEFQGDTIGIGTVTPVSRSFLPNENNHAIVLLKIDLERRRLVISDPNSPNQILSVPYYSSFDSNIQFRVPFTYGDRMMELLEITFLQRFIYKEK